VARQIDEIKTELKKAARTFDHQRVSELCNDIVAAIDRGETVPVAAAKSVLGTLRKKRYFLPIRQIAEALLQGGQTAAIVRKQYCQALIDTGQIAAAIGILEGLVAETQRTGDAAENAEARGLLGRAYKQIYVNGGRTDRQATETMKRSIDAYLSVYREAPTQHLWHGINVVACLCRAGRDELGLDGYPEPLQIARNVRAVIAGREQRDTWHLATAMEASVALAESEKALEWMARYVTSEYADAFELTATRRQLIEVWKLDHTGEPGDRLLHLLDAMLLRAEGGQIDLSANEVFHGPPALRDPVRQPHYEKAFGKDTYKTVEWIDEGRRQCRAVARISKKLGKSVGTGFLVRGGDLHDAWGDELLLLTNAHVVSEESAVHEHLSDPPLYPDEAEVSFDERPSAGKRYWVREILWSSAPWDLDGTLVRLAEPPGGLAHCEPHKRLPTPGGENRVYVIGHPLGGPLTWSLHDNFLLDHQDPKVHYRTPTDPGSSGSPVFNENWKLIALHHAGTEKMSKLNGLAGTYEANEGIWIQAIKRSVEESLDNRRVR
jgi:hypothetical protein